MSTSQQNKNTEIPQQVFTVKTNPCFRCEDKTGKERDLVISEETPMNDHIN